jgi:hypothetical protein
MQARRVTTATRVPRATTAAAAALVVGLTTAGCSAGGDAPSQRLLPLPEVTADLTVSSARDITLPFDAYALSNAEDARSMRAYHGLLAACTRRFGVTLTMPVGINPGLDHTNARRYGIVDEKLAASEGYGAASVPDPPRWLPSAAELRVIDGVPANGPNPPRDSRGNPLPAGGCVSEAERGLGGPQPFSTERMEGSANQRAEQHPRVQAAFRAWSTCMAGHGYRYASPWEPNDQDWPQPTGAAEIATARDDLACRKSTNLPGTWLAVESAMQEQLIARNRSQFDALARWKATRLERIRAQEAKVSG